MAFTDFTPQVNMAGSAYSTATGKYSQTVTSDTAVYLLEDFTNATSHMNVTLGTTDETYFSVSQFQQVGGLIAEVLNAIAQSQDGKAPLVESAIKERVKALTDRFPIY